MTQPWTGACLDGICFRATRLAGDSGVERLVVITSAKTMSNQQLGCRDAARGKEILHLQRQ